MGHISNEAHRGYGGMGHMGISTTGGMGYKGYWVQGVWVIWAMGHMGNGAHGPWGLWAIGPMGDLDFFAYNFINTEWILTKILLDIDIDVFYLNTGRFLHDGLNKSIFRWILNSVCSLLLAQIALISYAEIPSHVCACVMMSSRLFIVIKNEQEEGGSPAAILAKIWKLKPLLLGSQCIF